MKKLIFLTVFVVLNFSIKAQKVSNIRAEQRGQDVVVLYTLETNAACDVNLFLSQDNGATWSDPLKNVSGDVGKNITAGDKQIIWKVLEEREQLVGDKIKFKVFANGKKSFEPEMVFVEGGSYKMGSNSLEANEKPLHTVNLNSFRIGKYEITQRQWKAVMGNNSSYFSGCDDCPMENVSWDQVDLFIRELNSQTGNNYRLPTEAEWEYAAKGGNEGKGYTFCGSSDINSVAWHYKNSEGRTHVVGTKASNELGIYDMSGNVWEWCSDWYGNYTLASETDPLGPSAGKFKILRGGSWFNIEGTCHSSIRISSYPDREQSYYGFRLVLPNE
jgi:formylglycine-generating enzyme required for sulfatase activity